MHQSMPGYAIWFADDKLLTIDRPCDCEALFPQRHRSSGVGQWGGFVSPIPSIAKDSFSDFVRSDPASPRWASSPLTLIRLPVANGSMEATRQLHALIENAQVEATETGNGGFSGAKRPYVCCCRCRHQCRLLRRLSREAGPIEHYACRPHRTERTSWSLIHPRYQATKSIGNSGHRSKSLQFVACEAACVLVAKELINVHTYYRGLAALWKTQAIATVDQQCRIANRFNRMVFRSSAVRQLCLAKGIDASSPTFLNYAVSRSTHHFRQPEANRCGNMTEAFVGFLSSAYVAGGENRLKNSPRYI